MILLPKLPALWDYRPGIQPTQPSYVIFLMFCCILFASIFLRIFASMFFREIGLCISLFGWIFSLHSPFPWESLDMSCFPCLFQQSSDVIEIRTAFQNRGWEFLLWSFTYLSLPFPDLKLGFVFLFCTPDPVWWPLHVIVLTFRCTILNVQTLI